MTDVLDQEELRRRIAAASGDNVPETFDWPFQYIRPLSEAAEGYISAVGSGGGFKMGIPEIDCVTRGFSAGHFVVVFGASHSGKSQLVLNAIHNNPEKHVLWICPDEPAELVMQKLAALTLGLDADQLEQGVKDDDKAMLMALRAVAHESYPNLIMIDQALDRKQIVDAIHEAEDHWQAPCDLTGYDFLGQYPKGGDDPAGYALKVFELKQLSIGLPHPLLAVHQTSRSAGDLGKPHGRRGMRHGGENDATFALEVFRRMEDEDRTTYDRDRLATQLTVNICKNKVPPCKLRMVDLYMDKQTGRIREWRQSDYAIKPERRQQTWVQGELS